MVAIAPEGMTSNNRYLLRFRTGAFMHGAAVLPVCIKYRWRRLNPSWTLGSEPWHLLRMLCQFVNVVDLKIQPAYVPSPTEAAEPVQFAEGVRLAMVRPGSPLNARMHAHLGILPCCAAGPEWYHVARVPSQPCRYRSNASGAVAGSVEDLMHVRLWHGTHGGF